MEDVLGAGEIAVVVLGVVRRPTTSKVQSLVLRQMETGLFVFGKKIQKKFVCLVAA